MKAYIIFDEAQALDQAVDLLVELWPNPGATGMLVHRRTRQAAMLRRAPVSWPLSVAQTERGQELRARVLACQGRHGWAATYMAEDNLAICHDCTAPWLWAVAWVCEEEG